MKITFERGYGAVEGKLKKSAKYISSCDNCDFFYQAVGDDEEMCQNPAVLKYDLIITEERVYCTHWAPVTHKSVVAGGGMFMKGGKLHSGQKKDIFKSGKKSGK
jgi:hypothetical protein